MEMNRKNISSDCQCLLCWWSLNNKICWDRYHVSYDYNVRHIWIQWGHLTEHQDTLYVLGNLFWVNLDRDINILILLKMACRDQKVLQTNFLVAALVNEMIWIESPFLPVYILYAFSHY